MNNNLINMLEQIKKCDISNNSNKCEKIIIRIPQRIATLKWDPFMLITIDNTATPFSYHYL